VPLLIGTWSARTATLAGEIADEVKIGGSANPAMVRRMRQMLAIGSARISRSPDAVGIVVGAVTVVADDGNAARALARSTAGMYVDVVGRLDPSTKARAGESIDDQLFSQFAIAGTPDQVIAQAETRFEAGASRIEFGAPYGLSPDEGVRLLGERVLPRLRRD
jgi:5,10-methylenetetrahydromethanopterin reductase